MSASKQNTCLVVECNDPAVPSGLYCSPQHSRVERDRRASARRKAERGRTAIEAVQALTQPVVPLTPEEQIEAERARLVLATAKKDRNSFNRTEAKRQEYIAVLRDELQAFEASPMIAAPVAST